MKTCKILLKLSLVFAHSMFDVALIFYGKIFKSVEVLEKNVRTFLFNKACYVLAGRLRIQVPSS